MIIFSNPNGRDRYLWELWNQKMPDGTYKWHRYKFNVWDKPGFTQNDYDIFSVGLTRYQIESTMLAIFSTSDRAYFSEDEIKRSYDPNLTELSMVGKQCFFFLDVGAKHDQSVLCGGYIEPDIDNPDLVHVYVPIIKAYPVGYPLSRVIGINVDSSDGWEYHKSVREYIDEWSVDGIIPVLGVDATGNSGIVPLMQAAKLNPEDVIFSGVVKSGMYQRFKYFLEKGLLHRIKHDLFDNQARTLVMKKSKRGYLMIHHESEDDLDDVMDSIAGLIHLSDNRSSTPNSIKII
jgi:phage terminase large subunit-like protein